jgi:L-aspartate oxidase
MTEGAGVVRSAASLAAGADAVRAVAERVGSRAPASRAQGELANLVTAAASVLSSATMRCETRGAHARADYPQTDARWRRRIIHIEHGVTLIDVPAPQAGQDLPSGP